jgi:hypothetical protein
MASNDGSTGRVKSVRSVPPLFPNPEWTVSEYPSVGNRSSAKGQRSLAFSPAKRLRQAMAFRVNERIPGHSGGAVPDLHRIPCSSAGERLFSRSP